MRINFIFPFFSKKPGGGLKIMYEYAKRLSAKGHDVVIYHALKMPFTSNAEIADQKILRQYKWLKFWGKSFKRPKWIELPSKIKCNTIPFVCDKYIDDGDVIITTWWASVLEMAKLNPSKGKRINLIQGYEDWLGHENLLYQSYNAENTINIVIASYLYKIVSSFTINRVEIVPNSIDPDEFFIKVPPYQRKPATICMMYSKQDLKGSSFGLQALDILKQRYPQLEVNLFSVRSKPKGLPQWINYHKNPPNLCDLYNSSAIFISTSIQEGWGLPPMEAIACGCACVATKIDGHTEYLEDHRNCLFTAVKDVSSIVEKVSLLIDDTDTRLSIVANGEQSIKKYSWSASVSKFESICED